MSQEEGVEDYATKNFDYIQKNRFKFFTDFEILKS